MKGHATIVWAWTAETTRRRWDKARKRFAQIGAQFQSLEITDSAHGAGVVFWETWTVALPTDFVLQSIRRFLRKDIVGAQVYYGRGPGERTGHVQRTGQGSGPRVPFIVRQDAKGREYSVATDPGWARRVYADNEKLLDKLVYRYVRNNSRPSPETVGPFLIEKPGKAERAEGALKALLLALADSMRLAPSRETYDFALAVMEALSPQVVPRPERKHQEDCDDGRGLDRSFPRRSVVTDHEPDCAPTERDSWVGK